MFRIKIKRELKIKREYEEEKLLNLKVEQFKKQLIENIRAKNEISVILTEKSDSLSAIRENTKNKYTQMIDEFENTHGIAQLKTEIANLEHILEQLRSAKFCDHPATFRKRSSNGWRGS